MGCWASQMRQFMEKYDLLLTPTLPIPAFAVGKLSPVDDGTGKWVNWTPYSYPFNLTQQPAASVPCGFTKAGLPAGLHVVGRMFDDVTVLRACHAYEQATEWHTKRPKLAIDPASPRSMIRTAISTARRREQRTAIAIQKPPSASQEPEIHAEQAGDEGRRQEGGGQGRRA